MSGRFPLTLSAGKRYLVDQFGVPFLGLGDAGWEIVTTLGSTDATTYLADRQSRGFNLIPIELIDNQFNTGNTVNSSTWGPNVNGDLPFTTKQGGGAYTNAQTQSPDFSTPKASYWAQADSLLNLIASYGFNILLYPSWIGNPIGDPGDEGYYNAMVAQAGTVMQNYGKFLANRYGPGGSNPIPGLIWAIGGDNNPSNTAVNTDIVTGIQSIDTSHLFYVDGLDGSSMINLWGGDTWFGCNGIYSDELLGHPWMYAQCKSEYQNTSGLQSFYPQFMKEAAYENEHSSTQQFLRSQNWQAMLGGCWGYIQGVGGLWQFASGWQSLLGSTATLGSQVLNRFFSQRAWHLLVPDWTNAFVTNGGSYSNATYVSSAQSSDGRWGAIYTPANQSLTVAMGGFNAPMGAWWVDPTTGIKKKFLGMFAASGSQTFASTPGTNAGGDADWVLVFEPPTNCVLYGSI